MTHATSLPLVTTPGIVMQTIVNWILSELKNTPVALMGIMVLALFVYDLRVQVYDLKADHVTVQQFTSLQHELITVQFNLQHDHLDSRLHQVQAEVFTLTQKVAEERAKNQNVDSLYAQRLYDLDQQQKQILAKLDILDRTGAPLANP